MSALASPKAVRLLAECKVKPAGGAAVYFVEGTHDTYRVILGDGFATCECPALRGCSHLEAATLLHEALAVERAAAHRAKTTGSLAA